MRNQETCCARYSQYEVSRKAVNFYITHANRLVDLCPRRLELIAKALAAD